MRVNTATLVYSVTVYRNLQENSVRRCAFWLTGGLLALVDTTPTHYGEVKDEVKYSKLYSFMFE